MHVIGIPTYRAESTDIQLSFMLHIHVYRVLDKISILILSTAEVYTMNMKYLSRLRRVNMHTSSLREVVRYWLWLIKVQHQPPDFE